MGFNYTKLHFFDKDGHEIPVVYNAGIKVTIQNECNDNAEFNYVTDPSMNFSFQKIKGGGRFGKITTSEHTPATISTSKREIHSYVIADSSPYRTSIGEQYSISEISDPSIYPSIWDLDDDEMTFPSVTFEGNISFEKVSTMLTETQSIYVLVEHVNENGISELVTLYDEVSNNQDAAEWCGRYDILFFIDCRTQKDFRIFESENDEVSWSDRKFIDVSNGGSSGYRVNIGFSGENEGVYEQSMYVCIYDKLDGTSVYPIGEFHMHAETEGEDERYRALFANFGIPDPKEYENMFADSNTDDDIIDNILLNKHSKKLFISYDEIFPYSGTYKSVINMIRVLGYDDIFFKEWYEKIGETNNKKYVTVNSIDINDVYSRIDGIRKPDSENNIYSNSARKRKSGTIENSSINERIHVKKLNWMTMMYSMSREDFDSPIDVNGFPSVICTDKYYNDSMMVKLIEMKKFLERTAIGANCRITGVGGEGVIFERYSIPTYGGYQQIFEYSDEKNIGLSCDVDCVTIGNSFATIPITVHTGTHGKPGETFGGTFESFGKIRFSDVCYGYIDASGNYNEYTDSSDGGNLMYVGKTFSMSNSEDSFELKAVGTHDTFRLSRKGNGRYIDSSTVSIIIDGGEMFFDPFESSDNLLNSIFVNSPVIIIRKGRIRLAESDWSRDSELIEISRGKSIRDTYNVSYSTDSSSGRFNTSEPISLLPPFYEIESQSETYRVISRISDKGKYNWMSLDERESIINDSSSEWNVYSEKKLDMNFGLRYSAENPGRTPLFYIYGYESSQLNSAGLGTVFNPMKERIIEIEDGQMIFNDDENDRKIYINFSKDSSTLRNKVSVSSIKYSERFVAQEYKDGMDGENFSRFEPGRNYIDFISGYNEDPEKVVITPDTSVNVLNSGKYRIEAICMDSHNNMFTSRLGKEISVVTRDSSFSVSRVGGTYGYGNPIYSFKEKYHVTSGMTMDIPFDGSLCTDENEMMTSMISDTADRFRFIGYERHFRTNTPTDFVLIRETDDDGAVLPGDTDRMSLLRVDCPDDIPAIPENAAQYLEKVYGSDKCSSVYVTIYNERGEFPVIEFPANIVNISKMMTSGSDGDFNLDFSVDFNTSRSYHVNEYRIRPTNCTQEERREIADSIKRPENVVYIHPAWSLKFYAEPSRTTGDSSMFKCVYSGGYPFARKLDSSVSVKMLFADIMDGYDGVKYGQCAYNIVNSSGSNSMVYGEINRSYTRMGLDYTMIELEDSEHSYSIRQHKYEGVMENFLYDEDEDRFCTYGNVEGGTMIPADSSNGSIFYAVAYVDGSGNYYPATRVFDIDDDSVGTMQYMAHSHNSFTSYFCNVSVVGGCVAKMEENEMNGILSNYIDNTFTISFRDFDTDGGRLLWALDRSDEPYVFGSVVKVSSKWLSHIDGEDTNMWTIYRNMGNGHRRKELECYNESVYLNDPDGVYDIEMSSYDIYGNKRTCSVRSAINN